MICSKPIAPQPLDLLDPKVSILDFVFCPQPNLEDSGLAFSVRHPCLATRTALCLAWDLVGSRCSESQVGTVCAGKPGLSYPTFGILCGPFPLHHPSCCSMPRKGAQVTAASSCQKRPSCWFNSQGKHKPSSLYTLHSSRDTASDWSCNSRPCMRQPFHRPAAPWLGEAQQTAATTVWVSFLALPPAGACWSTSRASLGLA